MAIELIPRVGIQPVRSQTGGAEGRVVPMQDRSAGSALAIGEGLQDAGRALTALADSNQDRIDLAQSASLTNMLTMEHVNELEAPGGFLTKIGKDANRESAKQTGERLRQQREKLAKRATNDVQRQNFHEHADRLEMQSAVRMFRHENDQTVRYQAGEYKTRADLSVQTSIKFPGTDEGEVAFQSALRDLDTLADLYGWPEGSVQRENMKQEATDTRHIGVVQGLITARNSPAAREYFQKHSGEMSPTVRTRVEGAVHTASVADDSTMFSLQAINHAMQKGGTLAQQEEYAMQVADFTYKGKKISAEVRDEAQQRIATHYKRQRNVEAANDNDLFQRATNELLDDPLSTPKDLPVAMREALTNRGLMGDLNAWANSGKRSVTDPKAYAEVVNATPTALRKVTPAELVRTYRGRLDDRDLNMLLARQADAHGKATKQQKKLLSDEDRVTEGFYVATKRDRKTTLDDDDRRQLYAWKNRAEELMNAEPDPQNIPKERLQEIIDQVANDRVMVRRTDLGVDWADSDEERISALLTEEDRREAYVNVGGQPEDLGALPADVQEQIEAAIRAQDDEDRRNRRPLDKRGVSEQRVMQEWVRLGRPKTVR